MTLLVRVTPMCRQPFRVKWPVLILNHPVVCPVPLRKLPLEELVPLRVTISHCTWWMVCPFLLLPIIQQVIVLPALTSLTELLISTPRILRASPSLKGSQLPHFMVFVHPMVLLLLLQKVVPTILLEKQL